MNEKDKQMTKKRICNRYSEQFKQEVVSFVTKYSISKAVNKYNVHSTTISSWIKGLEEPSNSEDEEYYIENKSYGDLNIRKLCESSFIDWLSENINTLTYENIKEQVQLLKLIYQNMPTWLTNYSDRLEGETSSHHILYPAEFKSVVLTFMTKSELSQTEVSKVFRVSRKQLTEWSKHLSSRGHLNKVQGSSRNLLTNADIDEAIWKWYSEQRVPPSAQAVKQKALSLYKQNGNSEIKCSYGWYYKWCSRYKIKSKDKTKDIEIELINWLLKRIEQNKSTVHEDIRQQILELNKDPNFKASAGWILRFLRRNVNLFKNNVIHENILPNFIKNNYMNFNNEINKFILENNISNKQIGILDEIIIDFKINKQNNILTQDINNSLASCIICCDSNGNLLPVLLILSNKIHYVQNISDDLIIYYYNNKETYEGCFKYYIENIWFKNITKPNLLLFDEYITHQNNYIKELFNSNSYFYKIVPLRWISFASILSELSNMFIEISDDLWKQWRSLTTDNNTKVDNSVIIEWIIQTIENLKNKYKIKNNILSKKYLQPKPI